MISEETLRIACEAVIIRHRRLLEIVGEYRDAEGGRGDLLLWAARADAEAARSERAYGELARHLDRLATDRQRREGRAVESLRRAA
jgi:hypothetical protein